MLDQAYTDACIACTNAVIGAMRAGSPSCTRRARNEHPYAGSCRETPNREASGCSATASRHPSLLLQRSRLRIEPRGFARLVQRVFLFCA